MRKHILPEGYVFRPYRQDDLAAFQTIEMRATALIAEHGYPSLLKEPQPDQALMRKMLKGKSVWVVAQSADDRPIGYAVAGDLEGLFWLYQMSVDPSHGQQGIGKALLGAVIDHAKWAYYNAIGLTTFRDVAFNRPFYARFGFLVADLQKAPSFVQAQHKFELPYSIHPSTRVFMIKKL